MRRFAFCTLLFFAGFLVFMSGCLDDSEDARLLLAEQKMDSHADSSLIILQSLNPADFHSDRDRALYAMLLTQALDKNNLDIPDDSLISEAVDFFSAGKDGRRLTVATYYQGRARYLSGHIDSALLSYHRAHDLAESFDNYFWAGMACRGVADIHHDLFNKNEELRYARLEHNYTSKSGRQPYVDYSILDLARALCCIRDYGQSIKVAQEALDSATAHNDANLFQQAATIMLLSQSALGDYKKGDSIFHELESMHIANAEDSAHYAVNLSETEHPREALAYISRISQVQDNILNYVKYLSYRALGKPDSALMYLESLSDIEDKIFQTSYADESTALLSRHYESEKKLTQEKLKAAREASALILICLILLVFLFTLIILILRNNQRRKIDDKVLLAESLREQLKELDARNSELLSRLLPSKYGLLTELCEIVIKSSDKSAAKKKIAEAVTGLIENISVSGPEISELEESLNLYYDGIYNHLKSDLPGLKDKDYRLFLFSALGFPFSVISLLLNEDNITSLYERKRRLKNKITKLDSPHKSAYLALL